VAFIVLGLWFLAPIGLFGLAFVQILLCDIDPPRAFLLLASVLVVTGGSVGAYGHVLNDTFDVEADRRIGKKNWMAPFAPTTRALICAFFLVTAFAPALLVDYGRFAVALLVVECLLPTLYSIPPVRLKDRGFLGVLADAGGAHVVPALIVMTAFAGDQAMARPELLVLVAVWTTCLGLKGILLHQGLDREDDLRAGATTFAANADPSTVRAILTRLVYPVEVLTFTCIVVLLAPQAPLLAVVFALFVVLDLVKTALGWSYVFDPGQPDLERRHLPLASNFFYELWFPLALAVQLTLREPVFALLVALQLGVFFPNVREQAADILSVLDDVATRRARRTGWRRWGWHLELHGDARAHLSPCPTADDGVRVEIISPGILPWDVKLYRDHLNTIKGVSYEARFEARADETRTITYCLVAGAEPWGSLGLSEETTVGREWQRVTRRFVATADSDDAHAAFLLGHAEGSVELRGVELPVRVSDTAGS